MGGSRGNSCFAEGSFEKYKARKSGESPMNKNNHVKHCKTQGSEQKQ